MQNTDIIRSINQYLIDNGINSILYKRGSIQTGQCYIKIEQYHIYVLEEVIKVYLCRSGLVSSVPSEEIATIDLNNPESLQQLTELINAKSASNKQVSHRSQNHSHRDRLSNYY